jgi:very-short-patch-repair endonuclease
LLLDKGAGTFGVTEVVIPPCLRRWLLREDGGCQKTLHCKKSIMHQFNNNLKQFKTELRNNHSLPERIVWYNLLRKRLTGYTFTRQFIVGNYILDFYCHELKLNIELDGKTHDFSYEKDIERDSYLKSKGVRILRILNTDVLYNIDGVRIYIDRYIVNLTTSVISEMPAP